MGEVAAQERDPRGAILVEDTGGGAVDSLSHANTLGSVIFGDRVLGLMVGIKITKDWDVQGEVIGKEKIQIRVVVTGAGVHQGNLVTSKVGFNSQNVRDSVSQ